MDEEKEGKGCAKCVIAAGMFNKTATQYMKKNRGQAAMTVNSRILNFIVESFNLQ